MREIPSTPRLRTRARRVAARCVLVTTLGIQASCSRDPKAATKATVEDATTTAATSTTTAATEPPSGDLPTAGTKKMAALIQERLRQVRPEKVGFLNRERLPWARAQVAGATTPAQKRTRRFALARELLMTGLIEESVAELESLRTEVLASKPPEAEALLSDLRIELAIAWLRLGELENCLARHGPDSCLLPLKDGGVHLEKRGAERALAELDGALRANGQDLGARWLYNVAAMALGRWPHEVPAEWRIPESAFTSGGDFPRWYDVAASRGLEVVGLAGGVVAEDFDRDGDVDVMTSSSGPRDPTRLFRNEGDGTFVERTDHAGLQGELGGLNLTHADFDNDGLPDVLVLRGGWWGGQGKLPKSLLRNRGGLTFDDVSLAAGIDTLAPTQTAAVADFDGDGWLDFFVGNESTGNDVFPCELWWNRHDGTFENVAPRIGVDGRMFAKGVAAGDYDDDGRPDLYISVMGGPNVLLRNVASPSPPGFAFVDVTAKAGVAEPRFSFPAWFFDYDNDGRLDLFVAGYSGLVGRTVDDIARLYLGMPLDAANLPRLYRNRGDGTFEDVTQAMGIERVLVVMGANFGDLDNDGWSDVYLGTGDPDLKTLLPNRMFRNDGGRRFLDVTTAGGFGNVQKGHGVAFADFDRDGDQDVFAVLGGAVTSDVYHAALFENPGNANHWLGIELVGRRSNRCGVGVRIAVTVATPSGERTIHATGGTGGSFGSSTLEQEIGLGDAIAIRRIDVWWPASGVRQSFAGDAPAVGLDRRLRIEEGKDVPIALEPPRIDRAPPAR